MFLTNPYWRAARDQLIVLGGGAEEHMHRFQARLIPTPPGHNIAVLLILPLPV